MWYLNYLSCLSDLEYLIFVVIVLPVDILSIAQIEAVVKGESFTDF